MKREELKELIQRVLVELNKEPEQAPRPACVYGDGGGCDATTLYAVGEEG